MSWGPLLTKSEGLKLRLNCAKTRAAARQGFDDFVASDPTDDELELGSAYYAWAIYELDGRQ